MLDDSEVVLRARESSSSEGSSGFWLPRIEAERGLGFILVEVDGSGTVCVCGFE